MTDKELRKLSRAELLEMLLNQSKEVETLRKQLQEAQAKLDSRQIMLDEAGNIAEAALLVNGVFETAQQAAKDYLENIAQLKERQDSIGARIENESREKANQLLAETKAYCDSMKLETEQKCAEMVRSVRTVSQQYLDETTEKLKRLEQNFNKSTKL